METAERAPGRTIDIGKPNESNRTLVFGKLEREKGGREREREKEDRRQRKEQRIEASKEKSISPL